MKKLKKSHHFLLLKNNKFYELYFFFFILIFFSFFKMYKLDSLAITLLNGNLMKIHEIGIDIYNSSFNYLVKNIYNFTENNTVFNNIISIFPPEDYGYIISIINNQIYIFDWEGNFLYKNESKLYDIKSYSEFYYELVPIKSNGKQLSYMIGYPDGNNNIHLLFYEYKINNNSSKVLNSIIYKYPIEGNNLEAKLISCKLMKPDKRKELIVCFICIKEPRYITQFFIDSEKYIIDNSTESRYISLNYNSSNTIKSIRSSIDKDKKKCLVCFYVKYISVLCTFYSIDNNNFSQIIDYNITCRDKHHSNDLHYMRETKQFLFFCSDESNYLSMITFDENFNFTGKFKIWAQYSVNGFSINYSYDLKNYYIIIFDEKYKDGPLEYSSLEKIEPKEKKIENITNYIIEYEKRNSYSTNNILEAVSDIIPFSTFLESTIPALPSTFPKNETLFTEEISEELIKTEKIEIKKEDIKDEIPSILEDVEIGQIYKKIGENYTVLIYETNSTYLKNDTHVNFTECENILRNHYNIPKSNKITFFQIELENGDSNSLINQLEYLAFDGNKTLLNLSICKNANIQVFYSIKNNSQADFESAKYFKQSGIDIFNINDSFFNDICEPYSEYDNDLILEDRIKDKYQNYSLCEIGCTYEKMDFENMAIICNCKVKDDINIIISPINFQHVEGSSTNLDVIKCYNLVFSLEGKFDNIGFWIFSILVLADVPLLIYYFKKGIKPVREYIFKEMKKYGYIKDNKRKNDISNIEIINKSNDNISNKKIEQLLNSPPQRKKNRTKTVKIDKKFIIKKVKFNDNSSSKDIIKSINKYNMPDINNNKKKEVLFENDNEKKNDKFRKKFKRKFRTNKTEIVKDASKVTNRLKNIIYLPTQDISKNKSEENNAKDENEKNNNIKVYSLINMDLNLSRHKKYIPPNSHIILNNYTFEEAIRYDRRHICVIFYIYALSKQIFFHTFLFRSPLELFPLRLCLFIFIISSDLALNSLFYFNENISKKYRYAKNIFLFAFSDNITVIFLSTVVGFALLTILAKFSNSINDIREIFRKEEEKLKKDKKYKVTEKRKSEILLEIEEILKKYKNKVIILIIIELILMLFFWYFVVAFCHFYKSTQKSWLFDSFLSILYSAIIELLISFGFAYLYRIAVGSEFFCLYKIMIFLYNFGSN